MKMTPNQIAMLAAGIVLFVVAISLLVRSSMKGGSIKPAIALLPFAIVMIGFPSIQSFEIGGFKLEEQAVNDIETNTVALQNNSGNDVAKTRLEESLQKWENLVSTNDVSASEAEKIARGYAALGKPDLAIHWVSLSLQKTPDSPTAQNLLARERLAQLLPANPAKPLSPAARAELAAAVSQLSQRPDLSAEAHLTLSRAQLVLKNTNAAVASLHSALKANTNLVVEPQMKMLLKINPQ
jgi:tetratricopeptide (TPR) repeat protein